LPISKFPLGGFASAGEDIPDFLPDARFVRAKIKSYVR